LKYAYLAGNYTGNEVSSDLGVNGLSGFSSLQFAVPIGTKYAWGFGIKPVFFQQYMLEGSLSEFIANGDTLITQHMMNGSGGVSSLYSSFRFPLSSTEAMAIEVDALFGSLRRNTKFLLNDRAYHLFQRNIFTGSLYRLFISSNRFYKGKTPAKVYFMISRSLKSLDAKQYTFQPFEDVNDNGYFDSSPPGDNPSPASIPRAEITFYRQIYDPSELGFGIDLKKSERIHLMAEYYQWKDKSQIATGLFPLKSLYIKQSNQFSLGVAKFSPNVAFKFFHKIQLRSGFYYRKDILYDHSSLMNEFGLSVGFGIKFGLANNQLDFAYKYGLRSGEMISDEVIQHVSFGIHLGDRWFVKRRPK